MSFGVGTLVSGAEKKCFQIQHLMQGSRDHIKWNANVREKTLVGYIFIPFGLNLIWKIESNIFNEWI